MDHSSMEQDTISPSQVMTMPHPTNGMLLHFGPDAIILFDFWDVSSIGGSGVLFYLTGKKVQDLSSRAWQ